MPVPSGMIMMEGIVVNNVAINQYFVKGNNADMFSLRLVVIPESFMTLPEPPVKKKIINGPNLKICEKGTKVGIILVPQEEIVKHLAHSIKFPSNAGLLMQNIKKYSLQLSIILDFIQTFQQLPPMILKMDSNIFEENISKIKESLGTHEKLSHVAHKDTIVVRTSPISYVCPIKMSDEEFVLNYNKTENQLTVDKQPLDEEINYCCINHTKPLELTFRSSEKGQSIDFILDYLRRIVTSDNNYKKMSWPTMNPSIRAKNIDRQCSCRFNKDSLNGTTTLDDFHSIRDSYGRSNCKITPVIDMLTFIESLVDVEDLQPNINSLNEPCKQKDGKMVSKMLGYLPEALFFQTKSVTSSTRCLEKETTNKSYSFIDKQKPDDGSNVNLFGGQAYPSYFPTDRNYVVYYFTVEYNFDKEPKSKETSTNDPTSRESSNKDPSSRAPSSKGSSRAPSSKPSSKSSSKAPSTQASSESLESDRFAKFQYCPPTCPVLKIAENAACSKALCNIETIHKNDSSDSKCTSPVCTSKADYPLSPADSNIVIKLNEIYNPCCVKSCDIAERVKEFIAGSVTRNTSRKKCREMEDAQDPCYCDCVCTFKFSNKTTYCGICGGYECLGDDTKDLPDYARPHPCPVYHKLYNKKYINVKSPWPEDEDKKDTASTKQSKAAPAKATEKAVAAVKVTKTSAPEKEVKEGGQETKKNKKEEKKTVGKFTSNAAAEPTQAPVEKKKVDANKYAYPAVPKHMGWNWLAKDIPGMEHRPKWRPGAANKILVRRYRALMEGSDTFAKKKRALMQRKKKIEMKPTLIVSKQDGEFTVQMEVFKKYSKERLVYQYPYDEKPPLIYTIGKTAAERNKLQRQRDRRARRDSRRKSRLLQSTFRDKCQEICLKAYNQAIGLQPLPNPNYPDCPCTTAAEPTISPAIDSCSCSDELTISSSDTDHDEWVIEFTPPIANWDAKAKHPPVMEDDESQYNYLDYKVKLFDRAGNPVPRFFKTHEGKIECSDLGGFWGPGHVWLEINKDGFIGPDERWVPMNFFGPDGMSYSAEEGYFTDNTGQVLKLGIDGYVDKDLKWVWYSGKKKQRRNSITSADEPVKNGKSHGDPTTKGKAEGTKAKATASPQPSAGDKGKEEKGAGEKVPKGKAGDKKLVADPEKQATSGKKNSSDKAHNPVVMNVAVTRNKNKGPRIQKDRKPYVDPKKLSKYREIMAGLQTYDDFCAVTPPAKTNRASNTPRKKPSRHVIQTKHKPPESVTNETTTYAHTTNKTASTASTKGTTWGK